MSEIIEKIIKIETDVCWIKKSLSNHLTHHFKYTLFAWSVAGSAIIALIIALTKLS